MTRNYSHMNRKRTALLSLTSLATLSSGLVVPPSTGTSGFDTLDSQRNAGASSVRKSINFGPSVSARVYTQDKPSPSLSLWNAAAPAMGLGADDVVGPAVARAFGETMVVGSANTSIADVRRRLDQ